MTEAEWLACTDPRVMLEFLSGQVSARKLRLFGAACCRRIWDLLDNATRNAVATVERDGADVPDQLEAQVTAAIAGQLDEPSASRAMIAGLPRWWRARLALLSAQIEPVQRVVAEVVYERQQQCNDTHAALRANPGDEVRAARAAWDVAQTARVHEQVFQSALLRDIVGNPFRTVAADPSWRSDTVASLVQAIFTDGAFDRMPILGDALEDAGCDNADILAHCRELGVHARGCWAIDLLLAKE